MIFTHEEINAMHHLIGICYGMMYNERGRMSFGSKACFDQYDSDITFTRELLDKIDHIQNGEEYTNATALEDMQVIVASVTSGRSNAIPEQADQDLAQKILNMIENEFLDEEDRKPMPR